MPEKLEALLWCAALATWLMLLFTFGIEASKPLWKRIRSTIGKAFRLP
jgi:hypothetical protein